MELTKFSQNNLRVIRNFLHYAQMEDELEQTAIDYISEDHVDGESSEEAQLERALTSELILDEIYMTDDFDEVNPCRVYYNSTTELFYLVNSENQITLYKLSKPFEEIDSQNRIEILTYRLDKVKGSDELTLGDIFMHGEFIKNL